MEVSTLRLNLCIRHCLRWVGYQRKHSNEVSWSYVARRITGTDESLREVTGNEPTPGDVARGGGILEGNGLQAAEQHLDADDVEQDGEDFFESVHGEAGGQPGA